MDLNSTDGLSAEDLSFADDVFEGYVQDISDELPTSTELFEGAKLKDRDEVGDDIDLNDLFCRSNRRFEAGLGLSAIRSDVIKFKPVCNSI